MKLITTIVSFFLMVLFSDGLIQLYGKEQEKSPEIVMVKAFEKHYVVLYSNGVALVNSLNDHKERYSVSNVTTNGSGTLLENIDTQLLLIDSRSVLRKKYVCFIYNLILSPDGKRLLVVYREGAFGVDMHVKVFNVQENCCVCEYRIDKQYEFMSIAANPRFEKITMALIGQLPKEGSSREILPDCQPGKYLFFYDFSQKKTIKMQKLPKSKDSTAISGYCFSHNAVTMRCHKESNIYTAHSDSAGLEFSNKFFCTMNLVPKNEDDDFTVLTKIDLASDSIVYTKEGMEGIRYYVNSEGGDRLFVLCSTNKPHSDYSPVNLSKNELRDYEIRIYDMNTGDIIDRKRFPFDAQSLVLSKTSDKIMVIGGRFLEIWSITETGFGDCLRKRNDFYSYGWSQSCSFMENPEKVCLLGFDKRLIYNWKTDSITSFSLLGKSPLE